MHTNRKLISCVLALIAGAAFAYSPLSAREYVYQVGVFDKISQRGNVNVVYKALPDSAGIVCYSSATDYGSALEISNDKGRLTIREARNHGLSDLPTLYVYADYLSEIKQEGLSSIKAFLGSRVPSFSVSLTGNGSVDVEGIRANEVKASILTGKGTITLDGNGTEGRFSLAGTGTIDASTLNLDELKCTVLGTGVIDCAVSGTLDVRGIGTTKVYYTGKPEIKKVGGARIEKSSAKTENEAVTDEPDGMVKEELNFSDPSQGQRPESIGESETEFGEEI